MRKACGIPVNEYRYLIASRYFLTDTVSTSPVSRAEKITRLKFGKHVPILLFLCFEKNMQVIEYRCSAASKYFRADTVSTRPVSRAEKNNKIKVWKTCVNIVFMRRHAGYQ